MDNRIIPDELVKQTRGNNGNNIDPGVRAGLERAKQNPDSWVVAKGYNSKSAARVSASHANHRRKWMALTQGEPYEFRSWTDPEDGKVYVLVRFNSDRDWDEVDPSNLDLSDYEDPRV